MKIAHIIWALPIGGAENMLVDILNQQAISVDVMLVIINDVVDTQLLKKLNPSIEIYRVNRRVKSKNFYPFIRLNLKILLSKPDLVHCHDINLIQLLFIRRLSLLHSKFILTVHNTRRPCTYMEKYDNVFSISESVKKDIKTRCNIISDVIYNGIPFNKIKQKEDTVLAHSQQFKIVQIGRLDHNQKGQDIFLKAIQQLVYKYNISNIFVDFIGSGFSKDYLLDLAVNLQITSNINWLGPKDRDFVFECLKEYNLLVQPSLFEGFGLTVAEAMAAKVPVLVADIEGPAEITQGCRYGTIFKAGDHLDLADKINLIITNYNQPDYQNKISTACKYVAETFNITTTAERYIHTITL